MNDESHEKLRALLACARTARPPRDLWPRIEAAARRRRQHQPYVQAVAAAFAGFALYLAAAWAGGGASANGASRPLPEHAERLARHLQEALPYLTSQRVALAGEPLDARPERQLITTLGTRSEERKR